MKTAPKRPVDQIVENSGGVVACATLLVAQRERNQMLGSNELGM